MTTPLLLSGFLIGALATPLAEPYAGETRPVHRLYLGLVTAGTFGLLGRRIGSEPVLAALLYVAAAGVLLAHIDLKAKRLPDRLTLPSYGIAAALLATAVPFTHDGQRRFAHALLGMLALLLLYAAQALAVPTGLGLGDVKLSGVLGLCLGWFGQGTWLTALLATHVLGAFTAVTVMAARRTRKTEFAFGPHMLAGTLIAISTT
ncbi:prepilin peptidase [Spirillospora albida]|uniref:prepilin peptidase n=1 Tax=Spirillospora albida TaxID=58123 RepID=UPI0004C0ACA1|nr:prepilin peptidase [Spirillospora albida]